jgi:hypothetical protein
VRPVVGKYPPGSNRNSPTAFLPGPVGDVKTFLSKNKAKKIADEKVGKKLCHTYSYVEKETGRGCKLSVIPKTLSPVKLVVLGKKAADNVTSTYLSYKTGVPVADSVFELPKGAKIRPMPSRAASSKKPAQIEKTGPVANSSAPR